MSEGSGLKTICWSVGGMTTRKGVPVEFPNENKYDEEIGAAAERYAIPFALLKAQVAQESGFNPDAVSSCGARGLLQLMPGTDMEVDGDIDAFDPEGNLDNGAHYLRIQYSHFREIPDLNERWKFALAAYNGGRGHINRALRLARAADPEKWTTWEFARKYLDGCDIMQICGYVASIWRRFSLLSAREDGKRDEITKQVQQRNTGRCRPLRGSR